VYLFYGGAPMAMRVGARFNGRDGEDYLGSSLALLGRPFLAPRPHPGPGSWRTTWAPGLLVR
jgi:hypothetical protein